MNIFQRWVRFPFIVQSLLWLIFTTVVLCMIDLNYVFMPHTSLLFKPLHYGMVGLMGFALYEWVKESKKFRPDAHIFLLYCCSALITVIFLSAVFWIKQQSKIF